MIKLIPNANQKINSLAHEDSVISYYYATCENYANGYVHPFVSTMQILITKLGLIMASVSSGSKPKMSTCIQCLHYLCEVVLDNPALIETFDDIGINQKGNAGKHVIKTVKIDMLRTVTSYNNLVNRISDIYGLPALMQLVVRKQVRGKSDTQKTVQINQSSSLSANHSSGYSKNEKTKKQFSEEKKRPKESTSLMDENIKIKASLEKGDGRYVKGIFNKKSFVNFRLLVSIQNQNGLKISKVTAYIKGKGEQMEKRISTALESQTEFDLPIDTYGGNIEASVVVMYKIGLFKTKQIKVTVSKNF